MAPIVINCYFIWKCRQQSIIFVKQIMKRIINILSICGIWWLVSSAITAYAYEVDDKLPISDEIVAAPEIKVHSHAIEIIISDEQEHNVAVYALTGQQVKNMVVTNGSTHVDLMSGYYIVKIDDTAKRVIIR